MFCAGFDSLVTVGEDERNPLPTADRITRVFSNGSIHPPNPSSSEEENLPEKLDEIDFADIGRFQEEIDAVMSSHSSPPQPNATVDVVEGMFSNFLIEPKRTPSVTTSRDIVSNEISRDAPDASQTSSSSAEGEYITAGGDTTSTQQPLSLHDQTADYFPESKPSPATLPPHRANGMAVDQAEGIIWPERPQADSEPDEVIVYVAPHPRLRKANESHPSVPAVSLSRTSVPTGISHPLTPTPRPFPVVEPDLSTSTQPVASGTVQAPAFESVVFSFGNSSNPRKQPQNPLAFSPGKKTKMRVKVQRKEAASRKRRLERQAMFSSFGAITSEARLRREGPDVDPRWDERRRGDSDVDWGDEREDGEAPTAAIPNGNHIDEGGMDIDPDLMIDVGAKNNFVNGMSLAGARFVTMDDIADEEQMRREDEEGEDEEEEEEEEGSSEDENMNVVANDEEIPAFVGPGDVEAESDIGERLDVSSDEGISPRAGFQARLERLRRKAHSTRNVFVKSASSEFNSSEDDPSATLADEAEDFISSLNVSLLPIRNNCRMMLSGRRYLTTRMRFVALTRRRKNSYLVQSEMVTLTISKRLIRPVCILFCLCRYVLHNLTYHHLGEWEDWQLTPQLQDQWERDRTKKAEKKRARARARLEQAADPFSPKKGGRKGRKAMLAAAKLDVSVPIPCRIFNMATLVEQIRYFIADVGGRASMALPPMEKFQRKMVHEIALTFNLKSQSKGKGPGRYTTLSKTTRSGLGVDERKISRIIAGGGSDVFLGPVEGDKGKRKVGIPKQKEGDEVGKVICS